MGATHIAMLPARFFVISRLMRLEARTLSLEHLVIIHFECHIVRSARSHLIDVHKHTLAIWLENNHFSAINYGTFGEINACNSFGNTLSEIRPYKSSRNRMNRRYSPTASHIGITPWISSEKSLQPVDFNHDRITNQNNSGCRPEKFNK